MDRLTDNLSTVRFGLLWISIYVSCLYLSLRSGCQYLSLRFGLLLCIISVCASVSVSKSICASVGCLYLSLSKSEFFRSRICLFGWVLTQNSILSLSVVDGNYVYPVPLHSPSCPPSPSPHSNLSPTPLTPPPRLSPSPRPPSIHPSHIYKFSVSDEHYLSD
jgi:hypothetical protein